MRITVLGGLCWSPPIQGNYLLADLGFRGSGSGVKSLRVCGY